LLELLMVVTIILILAGMLMPAMIRIQQKARLRKAETEAKSLAAAIRAFHTEYGEWPGAPSTGGAWSNNNQVVLSCLVSGGSRNTRNINFFEVNDTTNTLYDPFKSNFPYRIEIGVTGNYVKVSSMGPDCVPGNDDIEVKN